MSKIVKNNKKMVRIGLQNEEINLLEQQAKLTGNSLSQVGRDLILGGLENLQVAENLTDNIKFYIAKLERKIEENDKKNMKILMLLLKQTAISKAYLENFNEEKSGKTKEEYFNFLDKIEHAAIKKMFERLKEVREKEDESL
ncbi:hypothetical protein ACOL22_06825 [Aliarcobacter butzleri]